MKLVKELSPEDREFVTVDRRFRLRPVQEEDAPGFRTAFLKLSQDEVIARFFSPLKSIDHLLSVLTSHNDDTHSAFVLEEMVSSVWRNEILGVARLGVNRDEDSAEFAVIINHDLYGLKIGEHLVRVLAHHAHLSEARCMYGLVLRDNHRMVRLCRRLGFSAGPEPGEPHVMRFDIDPIELCSPRVSEGA